MWEIIPLEIYSKTDSIVSRFYSLSKSAKNSTEVVGSVDGRYRIIFIENYANRLYSQLFNFKNKIQLDYFIISGHALEKQTLILPGLVLS